MGDDSLVLREDGYIRMNFPVTSLTYHSNLNVLLVKTDVGGVHVLDVNSGVILQSSCLSADEKGTLGVEYAAGADRVFVWDGNGVSARTDYNGVLLLHTALQRPLPSSQPDKIIRLELVLSEAVLFYQCLQSLESCNIEKLAEFVKEIENSIDSEPARKGVKAQKWSTVTLCMPQNILRGVVSSVISELKKQNRRVPALSIGSAITHRANDLVPCTPHEESRPLMNSEAERKETFKRWPHMDYKWALPARMAQAGFFHQPTPSGDDRAMCFWCNVCLVCWEKSDEPWVEHERHSPTCAFVRGEYTHNVPMSVTNATACAVPSPNVSVVSKGNTGDLIASGTADGKINVWQFKSGLKLVKFIFLSPYDSIFSGILAADTTHIQVWSASLEKDSSTYGIELTAMAFVGMTTPQDPYPQALNIESQEKDIETVKPKPALICAVIVTRTNEPQPHNLPIQDDSSKALFDSGGPIKSIESIQEMNDQNEAKSNQSNKMLFLLTYDIHNSQAASITTAVHTSNSSGNSKPGGSKKVCTVARTDDANIYDDIYFQYSDEDTELPPCTNVLIDDQISNVINLNASSSKEDSKLWEPAKKIILTKHFKMVPTTGGQHLLPSDFQEQAASAQASVLDFVGKMSQLKSWKSGTLDSVGTKLADQTDATLHSDTHLHHYLNMTGPLEISDLKWYESGEGTEKVKVTTFSGSKFGTQTAVPSSNNDGFENEPPQEEAVSQGVAVQCLSLPPKLNIRDDTRVTHIMPTEDKGHLLVVISSIEPDKVKGEEETDNDGDTKMVDSEHVERPKSDAKAYFILYEIYNKASIYTLEDNPLSMKELSYDESPVDLCLLPVENDKYAFAAVGADGGLRLYSLPDFRVLSEQRVPKGQFTSVTYCASVDRLSVSTKHGMIYFYALNNGERDSTGDMDEDEFANLDFDMLQRAPREETGAPVMIANKPELDTIDLKTLVTLTGCYGTNTPIPYSAVVPGFWCELSPAQRPRSDHQNNRTWRLQNTSSTWDEHVLELTLPYTVTLAHIEFAFTLHSVCPTNLPVIMVTLLKQNVHGLGYKKDATFSHRSESPITFPPIDADMTNLENPIHSEEYLQAHNAEILAGPLLLSSGLDVTQQAGVLTLTSPRLYRARGRTFLIHIKTLFDPAKDIKSKSEDGRSASKKFIGCDWLHQISLTVRSSPHTEIPMERQQRITMLESNGFLNALCEIGISNDDVKRRMYSLDIIIWVVSVRLQRMRVAKSEKGKLDTNSVETQQLECIKIIEKYVEALIRTCILCGDRSLAKKCVRIILITREGEKQLPKPWKCTFEASVCGCVAACVPYIGGVKSGGALRWLAALAQQCTPPAAAPDMVQRLLALLHQAAKPHAARQNSYYQVLRSRFGLYGLPFESSIFVPEAPENVRNGTSVTYASMLAADTSMPSPLRHDQQLRELLNWPKDTPVPSDPKTPAPWWAQTTGAGVFGLGLSEATPLHVTCHVASDGTKLESTGHRAHAAVVSSLPTAAVPDPHQLWSAVKEDQAKQTSQDPDSLEDVESSMMDCDPQEKLDFSEDKLFKEPEQCGIPWAALVARPPQQTLLVERMHSGARRYIVLDFGHVVRLTDVVIPACADLMTLCIDIWVTSEEADFAKLAFAGDISTKNLVLTDLQPPPLCRYMKITTIGRYGMTAVKCKIPLGWFYGDVADVPNVQASVSALNALHQDLSCRFRLATGKLTDLVNPYIGLYNGNACHMMAYLNSATEGDTRVTTAYNECIELQHQLHTCTNILRKLQNMPEDCSVVAECIAKKEISPETLLITASTDKLRVIIENVVDMLLYFYFQVPEVYPEVSREWCTSVIPLVWECGGVTAGALATLMARVCGSAPWWGEALAGSLTDAFAASQAPPTPLDRCLVLVIYMCRKSMSSHAEPEGGVAQALAARALELVVAPRPQAALTAAVLTTLAAVLDAVAASATTNRHARWDWVSGGWVGSGSGGSSAAASPRGGDCKLHRRKLHKKLLTQMQELEAARRGIHEQLEDQQRARVNLKARMAMLGKRGGSKSEGGSAEGSPTARPVSPALAAALASALVNHMLAADSACDADAMMLSAKVVGRLCALSGGAHLLERSCILGLAKLAVTLPPWPRHAITTLLQDLVEFESTDATSPASEEWGPSTGTGTGAGTPRVIRVTPERVARPFQPKPPRKHKGPTVADLLADSFGLPKTTNANGSKPKLNPLAGAMSPNSLKDLDAEEQLTQVAESDDSESSEEKLEQYFETLKAKEKKAADASVDRSKFVYSIISRGADLRMEGAGGGEGGAGEAAARRAILATGVALAAAVRAPPPTPPTPPRAPPTAPQAWHHPPLTHTLYDVFRHLALDFHKQMECTFMENVVALWLTLNGSAWATGGAWGLATSLATLAVPADTPRIRLASDTVTTLLQALCTYESVSLRCWVLSMQALAWIASLPLQCEGSTQTMGRVILESEHFVPALVKFVNMDVTTEGMVAACEPYLSGCTAGAGAGAGACAALQSVVSRVACSRGAAGALAVLRAVCAAWQRDAPRAYDLHAALLRLAHPMLQVLQPRQLHNALPLIQYIAEHSCMWVREVACAGAEAPEARTTGILVEMVVGGPGGGRRAPSRRSVLAQLLAYARRLLQAPLPPPAQQHSSAGSSGIPSSAEQSLTDESKAQHSGTDATNMEDEKKQQAARTPCLADTVLQHPEIMQQFYKTLTLCDGLNMIVVNAGCNLEANASIKEEVFWLVAQIATVSAHPANMVPSLVEFLKRSDIVHLTQAMQQLIVRLLENPEALAAFIELGGLELAVEKLSLKHQSGPSHKQGLVSSLMNYLKLPAQLINMSTPHNKKAQPLVPETSSGLINIAPLCTISCGNPTAQAADVLLEGGGGGGGARGACAARRVRAAAWSYHFFSADDASLALTLTLPYAVQLHEVQLQPHLTSLATCPGAVGVEAGCGGTVAPLGPPQPTAGMTFIRLVVARPVVCTTVQLRLYKPRDSSNMGLLQLRLLVAPAFNTPTHLDSPANTNNWASVVACCTRAGARLSNARWGALGTPDAISALCACVAVGGSAAVAAQRALLAAARALPSLRSRLLHALLDLDKNAYAHAFQVGAGRAHSSVGMICALVRALCRTCPQQTVQAYVEWLCFAASPAQEPPTPPAVHTLASVLWTLKEQQLMDNLEELITDDLFLAVFNWVHDISESNFLKHALDSVLCSMCYIRPELFKTLLERLNIPVDIDESMEGLTDDTKVHGSPLRSGGGGGSGGLSSADVARRLSASEVRTVAVAAMSPAATLLLLNSRLPQAIVDALIEFSEVGLAMLKEHMEGPSEDTKSSDEATMSEKTPNEKSDIVSMVRATYLVEWVSFMCAERRAKDWAGGPGSAFWRPLLRLLCYPHRDPSWQCTSQFAELEESTIKLFSEVTACHQQNQKLFATTLHSILESLPAQDGEGISGFTRALILRLVLSSERVWVALRWAGAGVEADAGGGAAAPPHPALAGLALRPLSTTTTVRDLLTDHRPPLPVMDETSKLAMNSQTSSGPASVLRSASDTAITTVAEAWELSLAAASASKDKRVKDVKNTSLKNQNNKKRQTKNDISVMSVNDDVLETTIRVQAAGLEGFISGSTTLGQLCACVPHVFGPHLVLTLHLNTNGEWSGAARGPTAVTGCAGGLSGGTVLREFGACGGLALVAARLPRPHAPPPDPPAKSSAHHDLDWVKLDDPYEEVVELGGGGGGCGGGAVGVAAEEAACGIPTHALAALGLLLKLPGYAAALLDEGAKAVHLLRLLMGVAHTEDGRSIVVGGGPGGFSLGTLPFRVVTRLLEESPRQTEAGSALRRTLHNCGATRMVLVCLAVFTHHRPTSNDASQTSNGTMVRAEDKSQLYWAKGTGFGTGSTQQSWNVEQALVRQRTEEEHVTVLLQVLASYMNPGEQWPPEESSLEEGAPEESQEDLTKDLPTEFIDLVATSSLLPAICSYLRNDSVLDMSRHIPLYVCVLRCARALHALRSERLASEMLPVPRLLQQMSRTTNSYATKLKMSKKNLFGKMTYSQRFSTSCNSELSEEDEGLAALIADIQATSALMCRVETELESHAPSALCLATREQRYIELMRTLQFETFEMIAECAENGFRFTVPYHFEPQVRASGERSAPARMKRLAQEAATLATSLPLSYSSSVFVRTDTDRLDVMKVLITGPSDTPYENGCFILDVYFPAEYPAVPMLINLETTGRHSVRFNPNLYNDGKVCLSVLNTWHGRPEEKWNAHTSSFLQVLVSIQSLILVPEPYFNEPGYERSRGSRLGVAASTEYNSNIYQACVRWAMLDQLRNPEPCFKDVIQNHFWMKRNEIMKTVANWITELESHQGDERTHRSVHHNAMALKRHYVKLQEELGKLECPPGLEELDEPFQLPAPPPPTPAPAPALASPPPAPLALLSNEDIDHDMEKIVSQVLD